MNIALSLEVTQILKNGTKVDDNKFDLFLVIDTFKDISHLIKVSRKRVSEIKT